MQKQHTSTDTNNDLQPDLQPDRPPQPLEGVEPVDQKVRRPRGFAAMDRQLVSEIARKGGKAAHSAGTAHEFTTEEAREAGRKGGQASHAKRRKQVAGAAEPLAVEKSGNE
jgi:general stress protein YciG